jgi:hypothetical protein
MVLAGFKPAATNGGTTTLRFVHPDHLGGTNVVTDEDGLMAQAIDYYPYGSKRIEYPSYHDPALAAHMEMIFEGPMLSLYRFTR